MPLFTYVETVLPEYHRIQEKNHNNNKPSRPLNTQNWHFWLYHYLDFGYFVDSEIEQHAHILTIFLNRSDT